MKYKIILLFISATLLTFLIYSTNKKNTLNVLSIYDKTTTVSNNYNKYIKQNLSKQININYNEDLSTDNLEIENIINKIKLHNSNTESIIHNSKIIIIYLGEFELIRENISIEELLNETSILFNEIRKINNKQIIYLSPINIKYSAAFKNICAKSNIEFININSYIKAEDIKDNMILPTGHKKISEIIITKIKSTWLI